MRILSKEKNVRAENREKRITEVKVDRKPVRFLMNAWNTFLNIVGGILATIGAFSLVHTDLRMEVMTIFNQFVDEVRLVF